MQTDAGPVWHEVKAFVPDHAKLRVMVVAGKVSEAVITYQAKKAE